MNTKQKLAMAVITICLILIIVAVTATGKIYIDKLDAGIKFRKNDKLVSKDGRFEMSIDGTDIVLSKLDIQIWKVTTVENIHYLMIQPTGQLSAFNSNNKLIWTLPVLAKYVNHKWVPNSKFYLQTDGNLVLYTPENISAWSSGTYTFR